MATVTANQWSNDPRFSSPPPGVQNLLGVWWSGWDRVKGGGWYEVVSKRFETSYVYKKILYLHLQHNSPLAQQYSSPSIPATSGLCPGSLLFKAFQAPSAIHAGSLVSKQWPLSWNLYLREEGEVCRSQIWQVGWCRSEIVCCSCEESSVTGSIVVMEQDAGSIVVMEQDAQTSTSCTMLFNLKETGSPFYC